MPQKNSERRLNDISYPSNEKQEKKKFRLRKVEEREANEEIERFIDEEVIFSETNPTDWWVRIKSEK